MLTDPKFKYRPSFDTDIRKTFAKARRQIGEPKVQALPPLTLAERKAIQQQERQREEVAA